MLKIIKIEFKRFYKTIFLIFAIYSLITIFLLKSSNAYLINFENNAIMILTLGINIYLLSQFIYDDYSDNRLLYIKSSISKTKQFYGKLIVIIIFTFIGLLISTFILNLKLLIFRNINQIDYIRMNLDYIPFRLIDRSIKEWFYPINFMLNILYFNIFVYLFITLFNHYNLTKTRLYRFIFSLILICIINSLLLYISNKLSSLFKILDFNYLNNRVKALILTNLEINFLSIISIIIYLLVSLLFIKIIIKNLKNI